MAALSLRYAPTRENHAHTKRAGREIIDMAARKTSVKVRTQRQSGSVRATVERKTGAAGRPPAKRFVPGCLSFVERGSALRI